MTHIYTANTEARVSNTSENMPWHGKLPVRNLLYLAAAAGTLLVLAGFIGLAYIWFSGGDGNASRPLAATSLTLKPGDTRTLFHLTQDESEARFIINEILLGSPKTVIGTTQQVAGEMLVDFNQPENTQVGMFQVNLRTLATDNEIRNRALRGQILQADKPENEIAEFVPSELVGLPSHIVEGQTLEFQMIGDLRLHGVTREVTFDVRLENVTKSRLEGIASTTVKHSDFGITIPEAAGVAGISDEVKLEIGLVALPDDAS
jgi:polyisoprenoid-binding protein YceI